MRIISGKARGTKLYTLEGNNTRPTLDRVKESIFNIVQDVVKDATVLDLFAGSGAIGLEFLSRGAKRAILCDKSKDAINIIKKNIEKTNMGQYVETKNMDFKKCLEEVKNEKFDIIYLDPPYETEYIKESLEIIQKFKIAKEDSLIILETDDDKRIEKELENLKLDIFKKKKYGRATIIFIKV